MSGPQAFSAQQPGQPVARPLARPSEIEQRRSDGETSALGARNTCPPVVSPSPRAGRRQLVSLATRLSERDRMILASVSAHRFLTTRQVERLHFADHASALTGARACRRVLGRLSAWRVLSHLERRIGGVRAGSSGFIWQVGPVGARLLALAGDDARRSRQEPSLRLTDHYLAVAETHVQLAEATRAERLELLRVQLEPDSWRSFLGVGGERRLLRPDLAIVTASGEFEDHWFLEVDLGTEHPPAIVRKSHLYEAYRASGQEQQRLGIFPRVVWLVPNEPRAERLTAALTRARLDPAAYRVVLATDLIAHLQGGAQ
jgi:hypothetical protein